MNDESYTHKGRFVGSYPGSEVRLIDDGEWWKSVVSRELYSKTTGLSAFGRLRLDLESIKEVKDAY